MSPAKLAREGTSAMSFEDYARMIDQDKHPALTLALAVIRTQMTLDDLIECNLSDDDLRGLGWLCTAAWECRMKMAEDYQVG